MGTERLRVGYGAVIRTEQDGAKRDLNKGVKKEFAGFSGCHRTFF